jgi:hypothetical protein
MKNLFNEILPLTFKKGRKVLSIILLIFTTLSVFLLTIDTEKNSMKTILTCYSIFLFFVFLCYIAYKKQWFQIKNDDQD